MKKTRRLTSLLVGLVPLLGCLSLLLGATPASMQDDKEPPPPKYMGAKACKKCHMKSSVGKQYKIWEEGKHAKAFELLKGEEAVKVGEKLGLKKKPHESPECLKCHTTAYGVDKKALGDKYDPEEGVTCEACHGAGEFFAKPADEHTHAEAFGKGYITPDEKLCRSCHNEESPTWNPERDTTKDGKKVGFDFERRWKEVNHPIPKEEDK